MQRARRTMILIALLAGTAGCASVAKPSKWVEVTPHQSSQDPSVAGADGYYAAAASAIMRRDYARALDLLQAADARRPGDVRVANAFGVVYDKLGRFDLSARYYAQAKAIVANSTVVANNMAYSAVLQGHGGAIGLASNSPTRAVAPEAQAPAAVASVAVRAATPRPVAPAEHSPAPKPQLVVWQQAPVQVAVAFQQFAADQLRKFELNQEVLRSAPAMVEAPAPEPMQADAPRVIAQAAAPAAAPLTWQAFPTRVVARLEGLALRQFQRFEALEVRKVNFVLMPEPATTPAQVAPTVARPTAVRTGVRLVANNRKVVSLDAAGPRRGVQRLDLLVGRGLQIVDASGRRASVESVRLALVRRGWSTHAALVAAPRPVEKSVILYPASKVLVAQGLARTLPFRTQLVDCDRCRGVQLTVGRDSLRGSAIARANKGRRL